MKRALVKFIVYLVVIVVVAGVGYYEYLTWRYPLRYQAEVKQAAEKYDIPQNFILAVIREESRFNPSAKSSVGAVGLMQLLPTSASWMAKKRGENLDVSTLTEPKVNIDYGSWYLKYLLNQYKNNYTTTIEAYNAGTTNVDEWEKVQAGYVAFPETAQFVERVKQSWSIYDKLYGENWDTSRYDIARILK